jgi:hypothetical protein
MKTTELKNLNLEKVLKEENASDKEIILSLYKEMLYTIHDDARNRPKSKKEVDNVLASSIYKSLDTAGYLI